MASQAVNHSYIMQHCYEKFDKQSSTKTGSSSQAPATHSSNSRTIKEHLEVLKMEQ